MTTLDRVMQLKGQGILDNDIATQLQQEGVSPKEIQDAMSQAQIKNAITNNTMDEQIPQPEMQAAPAPDMNAYAPAPQDAGVYQEEAYAQPGYDPYAGADSNMAIELAEHVFAEKIKPLQQQIDAANEFKTLSKVKLDHLEESVARIEAMMDKLQLAILDKVGSYGQNLESVKKEMGMMQETFSKTLPKLVKK